MSYHISIGYLQRIHILMSFYCFHINAMYELFSRFEFIVCESMIHVDYCVYWLCALWMTCLHMYIHMCFLKVFSNFNFVAGEIKACLTSSLLINSDWEETLQCGYQINSTVLESIHIFVSLFYILFQHQSRLSFS